MIRLGTVFKLQKKEYEDGPMHDGRYSPLIVSVLFVLLILFIIF